MAATATQPEVTTGAAARVEAGVVVATLPARFLAAVASVAELRGVPAAVLTAAADVAPELLRTPDARVPLQAIFAAWAAAMRAIRDDGFPIEVARTFSIEDFSLLGFAVMTAASGQEAISRVLRFSALVTNSGRWEVEATDRGLHLRWLRPGVRSLGHRVATESLLAEFLQVARGVLGPEVRAVAVSFKHRAPADTRMHHLHFGVTPNWQAKSDELVLAKSILTAVPSLSNPALSRHFEALAESQLDEAQRDSTTSGRVRRELLLVLTDGDPSSATIAKRLALSERTLRRLLAAEGHSFRRLVDEVRRARAALLIAERRISLAELAFALGFSELSAFTRAFKRWHGCAPSDARRLGGVSAAPRSE